MMTYTTAELLVMPGMLLLIIGSGLLLHFTMRRLPLAIRQIPLMAIALTVIVLEVVKQFYFISTNTWEFWDLPIHFCSFFLVWFTFALVSRGRWRQIAYSCALCGGILMTLLLYISPQMIINESCANPWRSFGYFHTFVFHFLVVTYWVWLLCLHVYQPTKKHLWQTPLMYALYFVLIIIFAYLFNTNYTNALYSNLPFMENLRVHAGQVVYTLVMYSFGVGMIAGLMALLYHFYRQRHTKQQARGQSEAENIK